MSKVSHLEVVKELPIHHYHENIILQAGKFSILGFLLDTIQNDGFCNRTPNTCALTDGGKSDRILWKSVNMGSHLSLSHATQFKPTSQFLYIYFICKI